MERRAHASQACGFPSIASAGATRPRNEGLDGGSLVTIAFRCELWRWSHQVLQEYIGQQKAHAVTFQGGSWCLISRPEGRGLRHQG